MKCLQRCTGLAERRDGCLGTLSATLPCCRIVRESAVAHELALDWFLQCRPNRVRSPVGVLKKGGKRKENGEMLGKM